MEVTIYSFEQGTKIPIYYMNNYRRNSSPRKCQHMASVNDSTFTLSLAALAGQLFPKTPWKLLVLWNFVCVGCGCGGSSQNLGRGNPSSLRCYRASTGSEVGPAHSCPELQRSRLSFHQSLFPFTKPPGRKSTFSSACRRLRTPLLKHFIS